MSFLKRMGFFLKMGFEKGDERSILVGFYSMRITWVFITVFLLVWTFQGVISTGRLGVQAVAFFSLHRRFTGLHTYITERSLVADG